MEPYGTIWNPMEPYRTLPRGKRRQKKIKSLRFGIIWNHMEPYETIWNPNYWWIDAEKSKLLRFGTIWNHMEPFLLVKEGQKN